MTQSDERKLILDAKTTAKTANDTAATAVKDAQSAATMADQVEKTLVASAIAWVADVTITYNSTVSLSLVPRTATFAVAGAKAGDRIYVHRRGKPTLAGVNVVAGIMLEGTGFVPADGSVEVYHVIPAVGAGQELKIPLRLVGYRSAVTV
ncbi:hypothetical protein [Agrobacterium rubi]|uniref:hypothetical protein n=1 Tax=Agrobacterium rubi TaxID=28099 RepID=UPI001571E7A8|nr:hypothetical protein [Agrobacterium rubi]NTE87188.1 hypothetical protein [Agrobacterium rubi]NTF03122.1 hypothetical protein [Agrobacterium rubi]